MSSRERILGRVRRALAGLPDTEPPIERTYLREHGHRTTAQTLDLLAENLADYRALVHRCTETELPGLITRLLAEHGSRRVLLPPALPPQWLPDGGPERVPDQAAHTAT
ncbi:lactate utilization protein C, partial [Streptomyces sp. NPDC093272]